MSAPGNQSGLIPGESEPGRAEGIAPGLRPRCCRGTRGCVEEPGRQEPQSGQAGGGWWTCPLEGRALPPPGRKAVFDVCVKDDDQGLDVTQFSIRTGLFVEETYLWSTPCQHNNEGCLDVIRFTPTAETPCRPDHTQPQVKEGKPFFLSSHPPNPFSIGSGFDFDLP